MPALERVDGGWRWRSVPVPGSRAAKGIWRSFRFLMVGTLAAGVGLLVYLGVREAIRGTGFGVGLAVMALVVAGVGAWALLDMARNACSSYPVITFQVEGGEADIVLGRRDRTLRVLLSDLQEIVVVHRTNTGGAVTDTLLRLKVRGRRHPMLSGRRDAELLAANELRAVLPERVRVEQVFR